MLSVHHPTENHAAAGMGRKSRATAGSRPPTAGSRPPTAGSARPTSAAIRHVSAANMAVHIPGTPGGSRLGSARQRGRSGSPSGGRPPRKGVGGFQSGPNAAITAWSSSRRGSVAASEDDSGVPHHPHLTQPQAWAAFESSIKEIADDTLYFTQKQHRNFRSSEAFKQVLTDLNYVPQVEVGAHDDDDVSLLSFRPGSGAGTADGSVAPSAADGEWTERQSVLSYADDDCISVSRTSGLGRKSPSVVHFMRGNSGGDYAPSTATARLTPAEEEPDETDDSANICQKKMAMTLLPVADLYTEPTDMRGELYQRYLHRPDTWTAGLSRHLHKTVTRERLPASSVWKTTQIFRPKSAIVNGTRYDNTAVRFKRVQSAFGQRTYTDRSGMDYGKRSTTPVKGTSKALNAFR